MIKALPQVALLEPCCSECNVEKTFEKTKHFTYAVSAA